MKNRRVYLAGPDVFFPDVTERAENLKIQCDLVGLEGVFPLDSEIKLEETSMSPPGSKERNGGRIYQANVGLIQSCSVVMANISPFRGPSIDPGTAFEMGYGKALGLIVVAYTDQNTLYKDRVKEDGLLIEDFDMIDNLMIHASTEGKIFSSPARALQYLSEFHFSNKLANNE